MTMPYRAELLILLAIRRWSSAKIFDGWYVSLLRQDFYCIGGDECIEENM